MAEQTITAADLLEAYDSYRTQHMTTRVVRGEYDPQYGDDIVRDSEHKPVTEDVLVVDAEVQHDGRWRAVRMIGTDANDESKPVFLDLDGAQRQILTMDDTLTVRGLGPAHPRTGPEQ